MSADAKEEELPVIFQRAYDADSILDLAGCTADGIAYAGFDPAVYRRAFLDSGAEFKDLTIALVTLAVTGNNPMKLTSSQKLKNAAVAGMVAAKIREMNITSTKPSPEGLTLARLGISFIAIYARLRKFLCSRGKIQPQFGIDLNLILQDPNMGAVAVLLNQERPYREYETRIESALSKGAGRRSQSDWLEVAVNGIERDELSMRLISNFSLDGEVSEDELIRVWDAYKASYSSEGIRNMPTLETMRDADGRVVERSA